MVESPLIFVSTRCIPGIQSVVSRISLFEKNGLSAIELGGSVSVDKAALSFISGLKQPLLIHNYFPPDTDPFVLNLASANPLIRERSVQFVCRAILLSARLHAPFYSVHAGFITDPTSFGKESFVFPMPSSPDSSQAAMANFIDSIRQVLDYAQPHGVKILVENNICTTDMRGKLILMEQSEFLTLFRALPTPHLGLLLDTGHLNVTSHTLGFDPLEFIEEMSSFIRAFHVHENDGIRDSHNPIQSRGWVMNVLKDPHFSRLPIVIEANFKDVMELHRHRDWLKGELEKTNK